MAADALVLLPDPVEKAGVGGIRRVIRRLRTDDVWLEVQLDGMAGDAEILKARPEKRDCRDIAYEGMVCRHLSNNAVGRNHIQHVQSLYDRGRQCIPAVAWLLITIACHLGVGGAEGNDPAEAEGVSMLRKISAFLIQLHECRSGESLDEWQLQLALEGRRLGEVDMVSLFFFGEIGFGHFLLTFRKQFGRVFSRIELNIQNTPVNFDVAILGSYAGDA